LGIVVLFPFYWLVMSSFKPESELFSSPPIFWPRNPVGFTNYVEAVRRVPIVQFYGNSLYVGVARTLAMLLTCSLAGYIFAKFEFRGKQWLFMTILATMMVPASVTLVPYFIVFKDLGLLDNLLALIVPGLTSASGIFLVRQYMHSVPDELIAAARIDGCGEYRIFAQVVLPLCTPVLSALAIFTFMDSWNDFLWPMLVLRSRSHMTLPVALSMYAGTMMRSQTRHLAFAFTSMVVLPPIAFFLVAQRQFVEGIALSGLKK
jgi:multiple sugar transport system permease protein